MTANCPHASQNYHFGRGGSDTEHQKHQADIATLLDGHLSIQRQVTILSNGFSAITISDDTDIAKTLQVHVSDMKARFASGRAIRSWDKVYALLFAYRDQIDINYTMLTNGVSSLVTTENADLVELLHAHAHAVSGFAAEGRAVSGNSYPISDALENLTLHPHNISNKTQES